MNEKKQAELDQSSNLDHSVVAIVGRPNVGKSALFNRLTRSNTSLVENLAGTTRDRIYRAFEWRGQVLRLVDTGGLVEGYTDDPFAELIHGGVDMVLAEAAVILFVVDGRSGLNPADAIIAERLRARDKSIILVMNKAEASDQQLSAAEFYSLGLGDPVGISALHGRGIGTLLDMIVNEVNLSSQVTNESNDFQATSELIRASIVGRPNVGKSSLTNAILGENRVIVSDIPGTTRDAIDTRFNFEGNSVLLVDTAGIRKRGRVDRGVERHSVQRAESAMARADVVILLLDYKELLTSQDTHIAGYVNENFKGLVIGVNKWDLAEDRSSRPELVKSIDYRYRFLPWAPVMFVSAKTGEGIQELLELVVTAYHVRRRRITTGELNRVIRQAMTTHSPPMVGTKRLKVMYATQAEIEPPTFVFFVNDPELVHFSYQRYLENQIRENFDYTGTAIRLIFRKRSEDRFENKSE